MNIKHLFPGPVKRLADVATLVEMLTKADVITKQEGFRFIPGFEGYHHTENVKRVGDFKTTINRLSTRLCTRRLATIN